MGRAQLSMLLDVQPSNDHAIDETGCHFFVSDISHEESYEHKSSTMFGTISRQPRCRFILSGIGEAATRDKKYLVYEDGAVWKSTTLEDLRYRTREFLCALHHLHYDLKVCHQNILFDPEKCLVVSRSLGSGKIAGMVGCNECSNNGKKTDVLCTKTAREKDVADLASYIRTSMSACIDDEFHDFLYDKDFLMELVSFPVEVIYEHPIWIAHPANKVSSRIVLNKRFQPFMDRALSDRNITGNIAQMAFEKYSEIKDWRDRVAEIPMLDNHLNYYETSYQKTKNDARELKCFARFARNASEHSKPEAYTDLEHHLEAIMPRLRSFMFEFMLKFTDDSNFADWNLVKLN